MMHLWLQKFWKQSCQKKPTTTTDAVKPCPAKLCALSLLPSLYCMVSGRLGCSLGRPPLRVPFSLWAPCWTQQLMCITSSPLQCCRMLSGTVLPLLWQQGGILFAQEGRSRLTCAPKWCMPWKVSRFLRRNGHHPFNVRTLRCSWYKCCFLSSRT